MKKRLLGILILTLVLISSAFGLVACGSSEKASEGLKYVLINEKEYEVVGIGECEDTDIVIPSKYKNKPVTSICSFAFEDCRWLRSVVIPDSVTNIGEGAFSGCVSLTSIEMPFVGATKDGTENTHFGYIFGAINSNANNNCVPNSLKTVVINSGSIGDSAFYNCTSLTSVVIPNSVTSIGDSAFAYCSSLTSVVIPNSVESIGENAFAYCSSLTSIEIPESVTSIGDSAFYYCTSLAYNEKDGLKYLGNSENKYLYLADVESTPITAALIDKNCRFIGSSVFKNCSSLLSVVIPNSVTSIGEKAFYNCSKLTSITIPNSVTSIGYYAFCICTSLTSITYNGTKAEWNAIKKGVLRESYAKVTYVTCKDGTLIL